MATAPPAPSEGRQNVSGCPATSVQSRSCRACRSVGAGRGGCVQLCRTGEVQPFQAVARPFVLAACTDSCPISAPRVVLPPRRTALFLRCDPLDHGLAPVAAIAAERDAWNQSGPGAFADPSLGDVEQLGDLGRGEQPVRHVADGSHWLFIIHVVTWRERSALSNASRSSSSSVIALASATYSAG